MTLNVMSFLELTLARMIKYDQILCGSKILEVIPEMNSMIFLMRLF